MLSITVDTLVDEMDGSIVDGDVSLRDAIEAANAVAGAETILFAPSLSGQTILLGGTQLTISDAVTIDASGLAAPVTIDAQAQSRIFNIDDGGVANDFDVTIAGLTLTGGHTSGFAFGGAVHSLTTGALSISDATIRGNTAGGLGGGIDAIGDVVLTRSSLSGNTAVGPGGALYTVGNVTLTESTISGNTSSDNGGGIFARQDVTLTQSTVSGNTAATSQGGGIVALVDAILNHSTVTGNVGHGGAGGVYGVESITLVSSIVAGNTADAGGDPDLRVFGGGAVSAQFSLVGDADGRTITGSGNIVGDSTGGGIVDPLLGPLADNGGPTLTHALLPSSPALDAGDSSAMPGMGGVPEFDQRGMPYDRVADGTGGGPRIDMGAYEAQAAPEAMPGDYNRNGVVDAADYTTWRDNLGAMGLTPLTGADGDGNGAVDETDFLVWRSHFGAEFALAGSGSGAVAATVAEQTAPPVETAANEAALVAAPTTPRISAELFVQFVPRAEPGADLPSRHAAISKLHVAPSSRAVDLLLAVTERFSPHDSSTGSPREFSWPVRLREASKHECSVAAIDVALAGLDAHL